MTACRFISPLVPMRYGMRVREVAALARVLTGQGPEFAPAWEDSRFGYPLPVIGIRSDLAAPSQLTLLGMDFGTEDATVVALAQAGDGKVTVIETWVPRG